MKRKNFYSDLLKSLQINLHMVNSGHSFMKLFPRSLFLSAFFIIAVTGFWACETEVNLNDEWEDIPVVYGLLNQKDDVHYVKINRAFLGEGDALKMASELDSITYKPKNLEVRLIELNEDNPVRSIPMDTTMIHDVDSGAFSYPDQIVYRTKGNSVDLSTDYQYRLEIYNKKYDKYIEGETELIHDFSIKRPLAGQELVSYTSPFPSKVNWSTAKKGRVHQLSIRIFYTNYFDNGEVKKSIDWTFPEKEASTLKGGEEQVTTIRGEQFYIFLKNSIPELPNVERTLDSVRYIVSVANDDFNIYMKVNEPSNSIIRKRPEYSNVSNGIGLFASRYHKHRTLQLNSESQDTLVDGHHTRHLNFKKTTP